MTVAALPNANTAVADKSQLSQAISNLVHEAAADPAAMGAIFVLGTNEQIFYIETVDLTAGPERPQIGWENRITEISVRANSLSQLTDLLADFSKAANAGPGGGFSGSALHDAIGIDGIAHCVSRSAAKTCHEIETSANGLYVFVNHAHYGLLLAPGTEKAPTDIGRRLRTLSASITNNQPGKTPTAAQPPTGLTAAIDPGP